jgi:hypothetical protein
MSAEVQRKLRLSEDILRYLTVRIDEEVKHGLKVARNTKPRRPRPVPAVRTRPPAPSKASASRSTTSSAPWPTPSRSPSASSTPAACSP